MTRKKAYVIGNSVSKSLSPIIFNYWFKKYQIDADYEYKEIKEENFHNEIKKILKEKNLCGLNITIPFKEKIIKYLNTIDEQANAIGAVNCVSKEGKKIIGTNTDWVGFIESIKWQEKNNLSKIKNKNLAIVVGYGGSAKAVIYALSLMGFKKIRVFNRSFNKISNLKNIVPHKLGDLESYFKEGGLIINTIPINYKKELTLNTHNTIINKNTKKTGYGFDLVYNYNTFFLKYISSKKRIYGYHMLIHQAAPCFFKWFGIQPEIDFELLDLLKKKVSKV